MELDPFLTIQDAANELEVTAGAIRIAIDEKRLPCVVKYGRKLIPRLELEAYRQRTRPDGVKPSGRPRRTE